MLSGADLRGHTTGRVGPKDNALELKRLNTLCLKEGVDPSCLTVADRYGKMIALGFSFIDLWSTDVLASLQDNLLRRQVLPLLGRGLQEHQGHMPPNPPVRDRSPPPRRTTPSRAAYRPSTTSENYLVIFLGPTA